MTSCNVLIAVTRGIMDENLLYKLALRLTTFPSDPDLENPRLIVGNVPQSLPFNIPFPTGSTILGSLIRSPRSLQIVLDTPLPHEEVNDFYERELKAVGWQVPEDDVRRHSGGFAHQGFSNVEFLHLVHSSGVIAAIQISDGENGMSAVRLNLNQNARSEQARRRRLHRPSSPVLPSLAPPKGAIQRSAGGSSGDTNANSSATLQLDKIWDIATLTKNYTDQLTQADWTQIDGEQAGHAAWSAWEFQTDDNEEWQAAFYLFQLPGEQIQYHLSLSAELKKTESQGGWFAKGSQT